MVELLTYSPTPVLAKLILASAAGLGAWLIFTRHGSNLLRYSRKELIEARVKEEGTMVDVLIFTFATNLTLDIMVVRMVPLYFDHEKLIPRPVLLPFHNLKPLL